jgi:antitoxin (DNA-binding transcriptional repressor) of toxin-antitoxin stability system
MVLMNQIESDTLSGMKTMTVTDVARNFSSVMDGVESEQEEIILIRNHKPIARLVPEPPEMTALEVLGDLYRTLDDGTADALAEAIKSARKGNQGTLDSLRNPWAS